MLRCLLQLPAAACLSVNHLPAAGQSPPPCTQLLHVYLGASCASACCQCDSCTQPQQPRHQQQCLAAANCVLAPTPGCLLSPTVRPLPLLLRLVAGAAVEEFLQVGLPGMGADAELLPSLEELGLPTAAELEAAAKPQVKQEQVSSFNTPLVCGFLRVAMATDFGACTAAVTPW